MTRVQHPQKEQIMTQQADVTLNKKRSLPVAGQSLDGRFGGSQSADLDIEAELKRFEAHERARLGLEATNNWIEDMADLGFTKSEKAKVTLLIGGLTMAHDYLVEGAFRSLGYNVLAMDCPDYESLRVGKEFGNRAQCNPTYFTVGNLIKFLIALRDKKGMSSQEIIEKFVFLTAGACGPCRFGMYVTEYRKALRDAGFDGFRVMLFQQQGGLKQATGEESGLDMNPKFFIGMLKGLVAGDVINGLTYRVRPYEVVPGSTDKAYEQAKHICHDALLNGKSVLRALNRVKKLFLDIEVDRTRPKPKVAIIGEFWAMTTEGDGNYQLQRFLEAEGAECDIQFVTAWLLYNIWEVRYDTLDRTGLRGEDSGKLGLKGVGEYGAFARKIGLWAGDRALRLAFHSFAYAGGFYDYHLPDMDEVASVAAPFYDNNLRGGEGHMEVGKLILNVVKNKANMTLSVKPFGCMPSSGVSDGVQSLITEKYPGTIFCAVETSGDGAVNFQSRVQMYLFKAKQAAAQEFSKALADCGFTLEQVNDFLDKHPRFGSPLHRSPHRAGSTSADLVYEVADRITRTRLERARETARRATGGAWRWLKGSTASAPKGARLARELAGELADIARAEAPALAHKTARAARRKAQRVLAFKQASADTRSTGASLDIAV